MKFKNMKYPVMVAPTHIPELAKIEHTDMGIRFGGSVTLSRLDVELKHAVDKYPGMTGVACIYFRLVGSCKHDPLWY